MPKKRVRAKRRSRQTKALSPRSAPLRLLAHLDRPATQEWRRWALRETKPRAIDLFSGAGGLSLGLEQAGYSVILAADTDPWCLETHRHNFPGPALDVDLSQSARVDSLLSLLRGIPLDLVAGGPPCQPFSRAGSSKIRSLVDEGKRTASDERRDLWRVFLRVVEELRPRAVLMENVPDMALGDEMTAVRTMLGRLEAIGYEAHAGLVDAWRHGVPQHRQRLFLVALADGHPFEWPRWQERVTLRDAIGDLPSLGQSVGLPEMPYRARPASAFQRRARVGAPADVLWDHVTRPVRADDREAFRLMRPGTRYSELPARLRRYRADIFDDKYNRLPWNSLSRSITAHIAKDGYWYIHPREHRTLTVREAARIQTFPDNFRFAGTRSHAFRQIGNAVPPLLGEALAVAVRDALSRQAPAPAYRYSARLQRIRGDLLAWATADAVTKPWRHPGDPWPALLGILCDPSERRGLAAKGLRRWPTAQAALMATRSRSAPLSRDRVRLLRAAAAHLVEGGLAGLQKWVARAKLADGERTLLHALVLAEDMVLVTPQALRVAARLFRRGLWQQRCNSDGKMALGHLVGTGAEVPRLNGALRALGTSVCTSRKPACSSCPLVDVCLSASAGRSRISREAASGAA